jgi:hypothetical protein
LYADVPLPLEGQSEHKAYNDVKMQLPLANNKTNLNLVLFAEISPQLNIPTMVLKPLHQNSKKLLLNLNKTNQPCCPSRDN